MSDSKKWEQVRIKINISPVCRHYKKEIVEDKMAIERLSKLQKWILLRMYKIGGINRNVIRGCFNKKHPGFFRTKGTYDSLTRSELVIIHRSINNMLNKNLIQINDELHYYYLTEKGFNAILKVNESDGVCESVSFKDYLKKLETNDVEFRKWRDPLLAKAKAKGIIKPKWRL